MAKEIFFCTITDEYIDYLRETDPKDPCVQFNKSFSVNESRKYVGVLLNFEDYKYFAPLASPKEKHKYMSAKTPDVYKIDNGKLGVINFNNMIPVVEGEYKAFDFNKVTNAFYKALLINQYIEIKANIDFIVQKARILRTMYKENNPANRALFARCCNFPELEKKAQRMIAARK